MSARSITGLTVFALLLCAAGCETVNVAGDIGGKVAPAPSLAVGMKWTYRGTEGFRVPVVWDETHEITAVGPTGISVRITLKGPTIEGVRTELWQAPGIVRVGALMDIETRRFATQLIRYQYPLAPGEKWSQFVDNFNERTNKEGQINRYVKVGGWEKVSTPAGEFDAIGMRVFMQLDDDEFWRYPTQCNYLIWYAPAVGATVREEKDAQYRERGENMDGTGWIRAQHTVLELVSYTK